MGIGYRKRINICVLTDGDGFEQRSEVTKTVWAEYKEQSVSPAFVGQQSITGRNYEFLIDYDSTLDIGFGYVIEYDNKVFTIKAIDRGHRIDVGRRSDYRFDPAEDGNYYRLLTVSEQSG